MKLARTLAITAALAAAAPLWASTHAHAIPADPPMSVATARLAGADRYGTAVAISSHRFPNGARAVYLVNGAAYADAVAASAVLDGPVLLVPGSGAVPASVLGEIRRLGSPTVYAVGSTGVLSDATLRSAAQGRPTARLAGADRYTTAAAVARHVGPTGGRVLLVNSTPTVDGVLAGQVPGTILPVPATGAAPAAIRAEVSRERPATVAAVGGPAVVSDATVRSTTGGATERIAGPDRYATSVALARRAGAAPRTVYVARGDVYADALASGVLTDGPVVLVPSTGALPGVVASYLRETRPTKVVALGSTGAVSDTVLTAAADAAAGRVPTRDVVLTSPYGSSGWSITPAPAAADVTCDVASPSAVSPNIYACQPDSAHAFACYPKPGVPDVVGCVVDPRGRTVIEHRNRGALPAVTDPPWAYSMPLAVELANGDRCDLAPTGSVGTRAEGDYGFMTCGAEALWTSPMPGNGRADWESYDGTVIAYRYGTQDAPDLTWADATVRYWLG